VDTVYKFLHCRKCQVVKTDRREFHKLTNAHQELYYNLCNVQNYANYKTIYHLRQKNWTSS